MGNDYNSNLYGIGLVKAFEIAKTLNNNSFTDLFN